MGEVQAGSVQMSALRPRGLRVALVGGVVAVEQPDALLASRVLVAASNSGITRLRDRRDGFEGLSLGWVGHDSPDRVDVWLAIHSADNNITHANLRIHRVNMYRSVRDCGIPPTLSLDALKGFCSYFLPIDALPMVNRQNH